MSPLPEEPVSPASDRYERALLSALGCPEPQTSPGGWAYQMLFVPTFERCSAATLIQTPSGVECYFSLLLGRTDDLFEAAYRAPETLSDLLAQPRSRLCEVALVPAESAIALCQTLQQIDPSRLTSVNNGGRDGLLVRSRWSSQGRSRTLWMLQPTATDNPKHTQWIRSTLAILHQCFPDPPLQAYLQGLA